MKKCLSGFRILILLFLVSRCIRNGDILFLGSLRIISMICADLFEDVSEQDWDVRHLFGVASWTLRRVLVLPLG